jgi:phosphoesterase RecJ-like protein
VSISTNTPHVTYTEQELDSALALLAGARDVTVLGHLNPDPDAFGSMVALGLALRALDATVRVSFGSPDELPPSLSVLDPGDLYVRASELPKQAPGLLVTVDCASLGRLDGLVDLPEATVEAGGSVLVVDHHLSNTRFGTHHLVDVTAESTTVIVLRLIDALGVELTEPIARAVYAGLLTDTSSFRRAKPSTHEVAARLIAAGVDPDKTGRALIGTHPFGRLGMLAAVLGRAIYDQEAARGLGVVFTSVLIEDMAGLPAEEAESVIDIVRGSGEAEVAAVLKQAGPTEWVGSLRAVGHLDVNAVATAFGGGGHRFAAGFSTTGTLDEVRERLFVALATAPLV